MSYCINCGEKLVESNKFCVKCGAKLGKNLLPEEQVIDQKKILDLKKNKLKLKSEKNSNKSYKVLISVIVLSIFYGVLTYLIHKPNLDEIQTLKATISNNQKRSGINKSKIETLKMNISDIKKSINFLKQENEGEQTLLLNESQIKELETLALSLYVLGETDAEIQAAIDARKAEMLRR